MNPYDMLVPDVPDVPAQFSFATVTDIDPVRIALDEDRDTDGNPVSLPYTPPTIASGIAIGSRVLVVKHNGRKTSSDPENNAQQGSKQLIILGTVGGDDRANVIEPSATSWDALTSPGLFGNLMHGTSHPNGPGGAYYYVQVYVYAGVSITQVGIPYITTDPIVYRHRYAGVWSTWKNTDSGWDAVTPAAGFTAGTGDNAPLARVRGGVVMFKGTITGPFAAGATTTFGTAPASCQYPDEDGRGSKTISTWSGIISYGNATSDGSLKAFFAVAATHVISLAGLSGYVLD